MLRNREFRRFAILYLLMAVIAVMLGFAINGAAGILVIVLATAFGAAFFLFCKAGYKHMGETAIHTGEQVRNRDQPYLDRAVAGGLAISHGGAGSMAVSVEEKRDAQNHEKTDLAGSLADLARQLRTPLTSANLVLSLLADTPDENERRAFVREAKELLLRMDWLLVSLLKTTRLEAGDVVFQSDPVEVGGLIRKALRPLLIPMELRNIDLQIDAPDGIMMRGDAQWLSVAIQNILKNCLERAGDEGTITIVCADDPLFTEIAIHDSGPGFEQEDLPHLFDRFYHGKEGDVTVYGTGLALCNMIVTRQNGTIATQNHPQGGAVFVLRFPKESLPAPR